MTVSGIADILEGAHRPGHFDGVATVVAKMLNMVGPDVAFFGAKDAQQVAVVRRMVTDLNIPVSIEVLPIVREPDGLAMSSRNVRLDPDERRRALALHRGLAAARDAAAAGQRDAAALADIVRGELARASLKAEYIAVLDPDTFTPLSTVERPALIALAARGRPSAPDRQLEVTP